MVEAINGTVTTEGKILYYMNLLNETLLAVMVLRPLSMVGQKGHNLILISTPFDQYHGLTCRENKYVHTLLDKILSWGGGGGGLTKPFKHLSPGN